jgi:putative flippase GtrA
MKPEMLFPELKPAGGILSVSNLRFHAIRALQYGLVSGVGMAIDFALFLTWLRAGLSPFAANIASSATALTFVYAASVRRIFRYHGQFILELFAIFLIFHLIGTPFVSWIISKLASFGVVPVLAKVGILPATFCVNYLFMSWLTARREEWIARMRRSVPRSVPLARAVEHDGADEGEADQAVFGPFDDGGDEDSAFEADVDAGTR